MLSSAASIGSRMAAGLNLTAKRFRHTSNLYPTYMLEDVKNVGKAGEIVMLRAGYARNFIQGTNKGLMVPRDERGFRLHQSVYAQLGFPIKTILGYYEGTVEPKSKGESFRTSSLDGLTGSSSASAQPTVANLLAARSEIARVLRASLQANPVRISAAADEKGALYGSVSPSTVLDEWHRRGINGLSVAIKHADQIYFWSPDEGGKVRKVKSAGVYKAGVSVPMVGNIEFEVEIVGTLPQALDRAQPTAAAVRRAAAVAESREAEAAAAAAAAAAGESTETAAAAPPSAADSETASAAAPAPAAPEAAAPAAPKTAA
ncbi:hypothetical protein H9P43_005072 [Blastocladiella emersonii ATCC 22665]|nr:hypothetical protein H9P43_005072 [Blastocladiella emersonii ATCC 22665]